MHNLPSMAHSRFTKVTKIVLTSSSGCHSFKLFSFKNLGTNANNPLKYFFLKKTCWAGISNYFHTISNLISTTESLLWCQGIVAVSKISKLFTLMQFLCLYSPFIWILAEGPKTYRENFWIKIKNYKFGGEVKIHPIEYLFPLLHNVIKYNLVISRWCCVIDELEV